MTQSERHAAILDLLELHPWPAELLAENFSVSPRTIYRDVSKMKADGAPILGEPGQGYRLDVDAVVASPAFTTADIAVLRRVFERALREGRDLASVSVTYAKIIEATRPAARPLLGDPDEVVRQHRIHTALSMPIGAAERDQLLERMYGEAIKAAKPRSLDVIEGDIRTLESELLEAIEAAR